MYFNDSFIGIVLCFAKIRQCLFVAGYSLFIHKYVDFDVFKKLENQTDKAIKIIMISTIIESILMLFLVISFIAMEIYLWNGQNILDTNNALLAIIPSSLYNSVGVLVDVLGLICLIVSFINLIHIYANKANLAIERNELI